MDNNRLTGSYYTSKKIAQYMVDWAIRDGSDSFLEPSFGDGVFLDAALRRYRDLENAQPNIIGIELQPTVYSKYMEEDSTIVHGYCQDFLTFQTTKKVTSVVGNPPYVSLRNLEEGARAEAINCAAKNKVKMLTSGSLWMPFIIHSTSMLVDNGRMAFVLPFELTYVKYAYPLWNFLGNNYGELRVIRIHEDFFPDVDVETIILMAENKGQTTTSVKYSIFNSADEMFVENPSLESDIPIADITCGKKPFIIALLSSEQQTMLQNIRDKGLIKPLIDDCKFNIGYVCADKEYFHPSAEIQTAYHIPDENMIPCISNAKEINGGTQIGAIVETNQCSSKLYLPQKITNADEKYIKYGVDKGVNLRYKCQQRNPWYLTPGIEMPELILTVFGDAPKLIVNNGRYAVSNSLLAGRISSSISPKNIVCMWYNSLTLLSIELNIHSLGGGVLVLIPGETDKLDVVQSIPEAQIETVFKQIDECIKSKGVQAAYDLGDKLVLKEIVGLPEEQIQQIQSAVSFLRFWRKPDIRRTKKK